ncbi:type II/IV secretion system protein [Alteromonas sp. 5E99-2]|nr:type II/IV secretion system protein [Alteromonas sp. 5E99-2]
MVIVNHLIASGAIEANNLELVQQTAKELQCSLTSAVTRLGLCGEDTLYHGISSVMKWPLIQNVTECPLSADVMSTVSEFELNIDWCIEHAIFPLKKSTEIALFCGWPVEESLVSLIQTLLPPEQKIQQLLLTPAMMASVSDDLSRERAVSELFGQKNTDLAALAEEAPVVNLVNSIIERAILAESSDIHIEAGAKSMKVRFRVDGKMLEFMQQPMTRFPAIASRLKLLSQLDIAERRLPQDGRFSTRANNRDFDVRLSTAPDVHGESIVMRLLPKQRDELSLQSLGFEDDHLNTIRNWGQLSNGIVLVTGPTGSGKSTTLYGLLADLKTGNEKILTVEDPVEYQLDGITQVQARPDIGYTFAKALRTFLRQDPDIIMVGEIRDKETADIAVQSSLTGHLVLSTLHTNDACSVFPRLSDIGVEPYLVAATIQGVQAQRLVRKLCSSCSEPTEAPGFITAMENGNWRKPVGCSECHGRGYKGRIGVYELITMTAELRELISSKAPVADIRQVARDGGARSLLDDGLLKASRGITSVEEVLRVCNIENDES